MGKRSLPQSWVSTEVHSNAFNITNMWLNSICWWSISWSNNHAVQSNRRNGLLEASIATLSSGMKLDIKIGSQEHVARISRSTGSSYIYLFLDVTYLRRIRLFLAPRHPTSHLIEKKINSNVGWNSSEQLMPSLSYANQEMTFFRGLGCHILAVCMFHHLAWISC